MIKKILKIIIFSLLTCFFVFNFSFASQSIENITPIINSIKNFLNVFWLPFSIIAWKLFTNEFIYAWVLWIDSLLYDIWNFSKIIANFAIGFILIVSIWMIFFGKWKNILGTMWKLIVSTILVNTSWYLIWFIIDISIILIIAVWALPMQLLSSSSIKPMKKIEYCSEFSVWTSIKEWTNTHEDVSNMNIKKYYNCDKEKTINDTDSFLASMNSLSWPLFYIWSTVLNLDKLLNIEKWGTEKPIEVLSVSFMLQFLIIFLFTIPVILLIFIGIIRIFWLWIYIGFSPLIFLDQIFWWKALWKHKYFKFSNMISLILQPVYIIFVLWLSVIFLWTLQTSFVKKWEDPAKDALGISGDSLLIQEKEMINIEWDFLNNTLENTWWAFGYIILTILSLILLWSLIKLIFKSNEITSSMTDSVYKFTEDSIKATPIIPTWSGFVWIGSVQKALKKSQITKGMKAESWENAKILIDKINKKLWIKMKDILVTDKNNWMDIIDDRAAYNDLYKDLQKFLEETIKNNPDIIPEIAPNFKKVLWAFINEIWNTFTKNKGWEAEKKYYENLWLLDKDWKPIKDYNKMFLWNRQEFRRIVSALIQDPKQLEYTQETPNNLFDRIKNKWVANRLSNNIWTISGQYQINKTY